MKFPDALDWFVREDGLTLVITASNLSKEEGTFRFFQSEEDAHAWCRAVSDRAMGGPPIQRVPREELAKKYPPAPKPPKE